MKEEELELKELFHNILELDNITNTLFNKDYYAENNRAFLNKSAKKIGNGWTYITNGNDKDRNFDDKYIIANQETFEDIINDIGEVNNVYVRACVYRDKNFRVGKKLATLSHLNIAYVYAISLDIDAIMHEVGFLEEEVIRISQTLIKHKCNCIVSSGRGLQGWWFLNETIPYEKLQGFMNIRESLRLTLQEELNDLVKIDKVDGYGGGQCRCPNTVNQKNGKRTNVIYWKETDVDYNDLYEDYYNPSINTPKLKKVKQSFNKEFKAKPKQATKIKVRMPITTKTVRHSNRSLFLDIDTPTTEKGVLESYRSYSNYVHCLFDDLLAVDDFLFKRGRSYRHMILLNYGLVLQACYNDKTKLFTLMNDLNQSFHSPLEEEEIINDIIPSLLDKQYKIPKGYEIAHYVLGNDFNEWRKEFPNNMTLCSPKEWDIKKKTYQKKGSQISNAKKKAVRNSAKAERNTLIKEYHKNGYSIRQMVKILHISDKTIQKVLKG